MQLDAFETNGASPPCRARGFAYRLRTVTLKLNEPPAEKLSDPTSALAFFRPIYATLDGDPTPSREDVRLTRRLSEAGKLLDLRVHDHLVLGHGDRFMSLAALGQMEG